MAHLAVPGWRNGGLELNVLNMVAVDAAEDAGSY